MVPERIDGFLAHRRGLSSFKAAEEMRSIKTVLLHIESLDSALVAKLREPNPPIVLRAPGIAATAVPSCGESPTLRSDLRAAAANRSNRLRSVTY